MKKDNQAARTNMDVIQRYAPGTDNNGDVKEEFCSRLSTITHNFSRRVITSVLAAFHAKTGNDNRGCDDIIRQKAVGEMYGNGEEFRRPLRQNQPVFLREFLLAHDTYDNLGTTRLVNRKPDNVRVHGRYAKNTVKKSMSANHRKCRYTQTR